MENEKKEIKEIKELKEIKIDKAEGKKMEEKEIKTIADINSAEYDKYLKYMTQVCVVMRKKDNPFGLNKQFEIYGELSDAVDFYSTRVKSEYVLSGLKERFKSNEYKVANVLSHINDKEGYRANYNGLFVTGTSAKTGKEFHGIDIRLSKDKYLRFFFNADKVELLGDISYLQVGLFDDLAEEEDVLEE